jgi:hypothetical protein
LGQPGRQTSIWGRIFAKIGANPAKTGGNSAKILDFPLNHFASDASKSASALSPKFKENGGKSGKNGCLKGPETRRQVRHEGSGLSDLARRRKSDG